LLKSVASDVVAPSDLCARVNNVICHNIVAHRFISCFYALLDTKSRKLSYANAVTVRPILTRDGSCVRLKEGGPVLGIFPDRLYMQDEIELRAGDCLVLFTDGVTEARNAEGKEFGEERLQDLLAVGQKLHATEFAGPHYGRGQ